METAVQQLHPFLQTNQPKPVISHIVQIKTLAIINNYHFNSFRRRHKGDRHLRCLGMANHIGQCFLSHAV